MADIFLNPDYFDFFKVASNTKKSIQIVISESFRSLLKGIKTDNKFVKRLLSPIRIKASYIINENVNFLDIITDDNGEPVITYLTPLEVSKRRGVYDTATLLGENTRRGVIFRRENTKPGRLLLKLFDKATNKEIEEFATLIKGININGGILSHFKEVAGDLITKYYNHASYSKIACEDASTLHKSCMRYSSTGVYLDIYSKNPDTVSLLILPDSNGKIKGRAIIWTLGPQKYIDRIYYDCFSTYTMFLKYCNARGIKNISEKNSSFCVSVDPSSFKVKLNNWKFMYYPYPDTLTYLNMDTGVLSTRQSDSTNKIMDKEYLVSLIPCFPELSKEEVLYNTCRNISKLRENGLEKTVLYNETSTRIFKIQSTGGKGDRLIKNAPKQSLVYAPKYNSYFPVNTVEGDINGVLSPIYDISSCIVLDQYGKPSTSARINLIFEESSIDRFVSPVLFNASYNSFTDGIRTVSPVCSFKQRRVVIRKEHSVKPIMFNKRLIREQATCLDTKDIESAVPTLLYNTPFKPIYDFLYTKYRLRKDKGITVKRSISLDILKILVDQSLHSNKNILSYKISENKYPYSIEGIFDNTYTGMAIQNMYYISQNCCHYKNDDFIEASLFKVDVLTEEGEIKIYCSDDLFEYTVNE